MKTLADHKPYRHMFVDAMNLCSRSYYGMQDLSFNGHKTGMLYGVVRLVLDWKVKYPHMNITFVWEGDNSWRKAEYPIYKSNRTSDKDSEPDVEFPRSVLVVQESLQSMGVDQVDADTFEADDTVYTVSEAVEGRKIFVSNDWDWWPLVAWGGVLYHDQKAKRNVILDEEAMQHRFSKKYKCDPISMDRLWLFKVLTGDSSDGVPGVPRFRKKIAAELANDPYVTMNNIPEQLEIRGYDTWAAVVKENMDVLKRNHTLLLPRPPDMKAVYRIPGEYSEEGFESVLLKSGMADMFERLSKGT